MDFIDIELTKWAKYNPRKDIKHPSWFALSNRLLEDPSFCDFTAEEFRAWIYVLCQASQKNSASVRLFFIHASKICGVSKRALTSALAKLEILESIQYAVRDPNLSVRERDPTLHNTTLHNKTEHKNAHAEAFALFWESYPRKVGKGKAEKSYKGLINSGMSPDQISQSLGNYLAYLRREKTESKYILHGPTFLNQVKDWLDPKSGESKGFAGGGIDWSKFKEPEGAA